MALYNRRDYTAAFDWGNGPGRRPMDYRARSGTTYRLMGLGQTETEAEAAVAAADPAALQAEIDRLTKENAELKKSKGKFWLGAAAGVAGSWAWGKWRNRSRGF